jgi:hypothetical protein
VGPGGCRTFPASEGDVLAYIGFLKLEGSVSSASLPQYLSTVSRYHELAGVASPKKTALVRSLVRAYDRALGIDALACHVWASPPPYYGGFFLWASRPLSRLWCVLPEWSCICFYLGVAHRRLSAFATQILK